mmetsp:Transcript_25572/g.33449  ORF Transcript_25572/g.33449 Transcript_25572/m.33449 type:complete len:304 (-) Transcript_25572:270-1181(-)
MALCVHINKEIRSIMHLRRLFLRPLGHHFVSIPSTTKIIKGQLRTQQSALERSYYSLADTLHFGMSAFHQAGLPWWSSIALTTVAARCSLFPLVWWQTQEISPFAKALPKVQHLWRLFRNQWQEVPSEDGRHRRYLLSMLRQGTGAALDLENCRPGLVLGLPLVQLGLFVYFIQSIRSLLVQGQLPGIEAGGMLWFTNLTEVDPTLVLPVSAIAMTYSNLELGFVKPKPASISTQKDQEPGLANQLKDYFQVYLILSVPFVMQLPAGVFMYWIPSSLFGTCQIILLKNNSFRSVVGLPLTPKV